MRRATLFLGLAVLILSIGISMAEDSVEEIKIPEIPRDVRYNEVISERVAQSVMNFAHNLAVALDTNEFPNTQIFSPLSVMSALSLLQMGSYGNSYKQLNELFSLLKGENSSKIHEEFGWLLEDTMLKTVSNPKRPRSLPEWRSTPFKSHEFDGPHPDDLNGHTIRVSNALFVQNGFSLKPDYAHAAQSVYKSEVTPLDFRQDQKHAKDYINSWVNQNTLGKIPTIIEGEVSSETNIILASTLYFKGFWETLFFDARKQKEPFYPDGPDSYPVGITIMGTGGTFPFYHSKELDCRVIGLPYKENQTTMYVFQPIDSTRLKLQQLQKNLTGERMNELISKMVYKTAILVFPKFHVESKMEMKDPLKRMGIEDIFKNGVADLALIADPEENQKEVIGASSSSSSSWAALLEPETNQVASKSSGPLDRYEEAPLIFSRFSENNETTTMPPESSTDEKLSRKRREVIPESAISLQKLDQLRATPGLKKPKLYVDEILHKVDFNVNEQGTEAAAATLGILNKSGPEVTMRCDTPFLILVRHDPTKLPLFYGLINIPA